MFLRYFFVILHLNSICTTCLAPCDVATESECDAAIKIVTNMYLYVVAFGISTFTIDANMPKANEVDINANIYPMAAESDENNKQ